jgi:hypothetical protein
MIMRRPLLLTAVLALIGALAVSASAVGPTVGADARVTRQTYVRHDGGTDAAIEICNSTAPDDYGNLTVNNEPFSVVSPTDPSLVIAGWNDYCSDWMGLGFSIDGGASWTNSLVPGYPADTSTEGMASPEYIRTNAASDPVAAFNRTGTRFFFGSISFNGFAGPKTNSDVWVARYAVRPTSDPLYATYPLDYLGTTRVGRGPSAANFQGRFNDKEMIEVDRTGGPNDGNVYMCWTKFPAFGSSQIYFSRSTNNGRTFSKGIAISPARPGQGCDIAVEADGDVYVLWRDFELSGSKKNFGISSVRSGDAGLTFSKPVKVAALPQYTPFDTARDCGDGTEACPSGFVFSRVPLEPRITSDPTGELPGIYAVVQQGDRSTEVDSDTSYYTTGVPGRVSRGIVTVYRSLDDGATWSGPYRVTSAARGHQFFPDADALDGRLAVVWQDSRVDPAYSVQRPVGNTAAATSSGTAVVKTYVAVSSNGTTFGSERIVSSVGNQPQYEMFAAASVPFYGDYNWIQLMRRSDGSLFGYMVWTDNRDVVPGTDPRETTQDGFDVESGWAPQPDGTYTRQFNLGGYDQNIYGNSISIP